MSKFDERANAFENMFARDEELKFNALARRNRLIAQWAAEKLGKENAEEYLREVIRADMKSAGDEDVFAKLREDFDAAGIEQTDETIREKLLSFLAEAIEQVKNKS